MLPSNAGMTDLGKKKKERKLKVIYLSIMLNHNDNESFMLKAS